MVIVYQNRMNIDAAEVNDHLLRVIGNVFSVIVYQWGMNCGQNLVSVINPALFGYSLANDLKTRSFPAEQVIPTS